MNSSYKGTNFVFGDFQLHAYDGRLRRIPDGHCVVLPPTLLEILLTLVEDAGQVVAKQQFLDRVWPERVVEEGNLSRNVSNLRKILEDDAQHPRYIETAAGRGYRFVADVSVEAAAETSVNTPPEPASSNSGSRFTALLVSGLVLCVVAAATLLTTPSQPDSTADSRIALQIRSLAVLPFENLSGDPGQNWFADGMTEELISTLASIGELDLTSRTSSMQYRNSEKALPTIARELGVRGIVEGSVVRSADQVRLSVRLIDAESDRSLWSASFEREASESFSMHGEIVVQLADQLGIELPSAQELRLNRRAPIDQVAHEAYLLGRHFKNKRTVESLQQAIAYFDRAIEIEPEFSRAYAAKADTYLSLASWQGPSRELWPKARSAADAAIALDRNDAEALIVRAGALLCHDLDAKAAEPIYLQALELNPNNTLSIHRYSYSLMTQGRFDESIGWARKALRLNPVSASLNVALGQRFHYARQYDEAVQQLEHALALNPNYPEAHRVLGLVYLQTGKAREAIVALKLAHQLGGGPGVVGELGYAYARAGQTDDALTQLTILESMALKGRDTAYGFALVLHGLGNSDQAFTWLERAYGERDFRMIYLRIEPIWDDLRDDARFEAFLKRIGFEPQEMHAA